MQEYLINYILNCNKMKTFVTICFLVAKMFKFQYDVAFPYQFVTISAWCLLFHCARGALFFEMNFWVSLIFVTRFNFFFDVYVVGIGLVVLVRIHVYVQIGEERG